MRIAMLLDHGGLEDSRIARSVSALEGAGHVVAVFAAIARPGAPKIKQIEPGGGQYALTHCTFDPGQTIPILSRFKRQPLSRMASGAAKHNVILRFQNPQGGFGSELKRALGSWRLPAIAAAAMGPAIAEFAPHVIHANALTTLGAGQRLARAHSCRLVYDSHEYERGRNLQLNSVQKRLAIAQETRGVREASAVITVSESIADRLRDHYGCSVTVVLNSPAYHTDVPDKSPSKGDGDLVYVGGMQEGRGVENLLEAMGNLPDERLVLMGPVSQERQLELEDCARRYGVSERIVFAPPVVPQDVVRALLGFGMSVIPLPRHTPSYNMSMPNKLLESVAAGVPVVATPLAEVSRFLMHTQAGHVSVGEKAADLAAAIRKARAHSCSAALPEPYGWDRMRERLVGVYAALQAGEPVPDSPPLPHWTEPAQA